MSRLKEMFPTPTRAALAVACLCVILVTAGVCIVMIANGARGPEQSTAIGGEAAQNFAFADAGVDPASAQAVKVKYERYQGTFVYEVEFLAGETEYEYKINAADGSVVKKEQKAVMGPGNSVPVAGTITLEEARDIALADAGVAREEAVFTEAKQDMERGVPVFEFKFYGGNVEYEYEINGQTGAVYSKKTTTYVSQDPAGTPPPVQTAPPTSQPPATQPPATAKPSRTAASPTALEQVFRTIRLSYLSTTSRIESVEKSIYASSITTNRSGKPSTIRRTDPRDAESEVGLQGFERMTSRTSRSLAKATSASASSARVSAGFSNTSTDTPAACA